VWRADSQTGTRASRLAARTLKGWSARLGERAALFGGWRMRRIISSLVSACCAVVVLALDGCGAGSVAPQPIPQVHKPSDCQAFSAHRRRIQSIRQIRDVCDGSSFGDPASLSDPTIGTYIDPGPGTGPPPLLPPGTPPGPPPPPFTGGPVPGEWDPIWFFSDLNFNYMAGPAYVNIGTIAVGSISDVSIGISTAGSDGINIPTAGHLYVQLWSYGTPIGAPLQAGSVNGKLKPANFPQDVFGQSHLYINGSIPYLVGLAVSLTKHATAYASNASCIPNYDPVSMNSNSWATGLLLAAGLSQDQINRDVVALYQGSGLLPDGVSEGYRIVNCF